MPMYTFRCPDCGKRFEELLTISQKDAVLCPDCGAKAERVWMGKCAFGAKRADERLPQCADCPMCGR